MFILSSGNQFDVDDAILASLENLNVDLDIESGVRIDQCKDIAFEKRMFFLTRSALAFAADLTFNQSNIPALVSQSRLILTDVQH